MKKALKIILFVFIGFTVVGWLGAILSNDSKEESPLVDADTKTYKEDSIKAYKQYQDSILVANSLKELEELKRNFIYQEDKFNGDAWYVHKRWGNYWPTRKAITAHVNKSGFSYLRSVYFSSDWIFHQQAIFLIDENRLNTQWVESYDNNNVTKVVDGGIYEVVSYDDSEHILSAISNAVDKTIKVRLVGNQYHTDFTLSKGEKQAIADVYRLGELLKITQGIEP